MAENQYIALSIFGVKGNVCFKVKRLAAFQKLFRAYEQHVKLQEGSVEYYCRGKKLAETDAPGHVSIAWKGEITQRTSHLAPGIARSGWTPGRRRHF